jgi:hypothetical protein
VRRLRQTIFGDGKGNCFATCLASLLEVPVESVPNFHADYPSTWWTETQKWLYARGFVAIEVFLRSDGHKVVDWAPAVSCILTGKSPRGDFLHCVVGRTDPDNGGFAMVHDPHPDDTFIDGKPTRVLFLVPTMPELVLAA